MHPYSTLNIPSKTLIQPVQLEPLNTSSSSPFPTDKTLGFTTREASNDDIGIINELNPMLIGLRALVPRKQMVILKAVMMFDCSRIGLGDLGVVMNDVWME
jgi:hypothetical protein